MIVSPLPYVLQVELGEFVDVKPFVIAVHLRRDPATCTDGDLPTGWRRPRRLPDDRPAAAGTPRRGTRQRRPRRAEATHAAAASVIQRVAALRQLGSVATRVSAGDLVE